MSEYPCYPGRNRMDLAGFWDFLFIPEKCLTLSQLDPVDGLTFRDLQPVPGCFDASPVYEGCRRTTDHPNLP